MTDRREPNVADPLSEPTINRRLTAAYRHCGFTRASFARAMGASYSTVDDWDTEKYLPGFEYLVKARLVLKKFSLDQLAYGHNAPSGFLVQQRQEVELGRDAIKQLLRDLKATADQLQALHDYEISGAGQYTLFTRSFVTAYVNAYAAARQENIEHRPAIDRAKTVAVNAAAQLEAVAAGVTRTVTDAELAELGRTLRAVDAEADKRTGADSSSSSTPPHVASVAVLPRKPRKRTKSRSARRPA